MKKRLTVLSSILPEPQFMDALRNHLLTSELRNGISAVLRVRVNAHIAIISRAGKHSADTKLMEQAACRLRECLRSSDIVAFSKPGIFLVLLPDLNSENALATICEQIVQAGRRSFDLDDTEVYSGYNVGAAIISQSDNAISLVRRATATMYQRDRYGEGGFELFPSEVAKRSLDPAAIESAVFNALKKDLIGLDFQPQYRGDGRLIGASAILRIDCPGGERLQGEAFLASVEERELILRVGDRALRQLCFQVEDWLQRGVSIPSVSLAVAASQFLRPEFPKIVGLLLRTTRIPGSLLEFELTESAIMTDFETAKQTLTALTKLGVRFALRGVSMGSLLASWVTRLPIATLQLSCSPNTSPSVDSPSILRAVISHGHRLGLRVTAADIQSETQLTALRIAGCDGFQGPLLSEPLKKEEMEELLPARNSYLKKA